MLHEGFYKVQFSADGFGEGVVLVEGGRIRGGDDQMVYSGQYGETGSDPSRGSQIEVELSIQAYTPNAQSVVGTGSRPFKLILKGTSDGRQFSVSGNSPRSGGTPFQARGNFIAPLDF